jgi:hypothetical protein
MNNCTFLHIGGGICPYHTKSCDKPCRQYSIVGDNAKPIFNDWNNGLEKLANGIKQKYFGTDENDINDFLGI